MATEHGAQEAASPPHFDKRRVYQAFRQSLPAKLREDRYFKVFYSDIMPARVVIIGLNPGGDPNNPEELKSASLFFENGEHDYVDCDYVLARKMRVLLDRSGLGSSRDAIGRIPKINVVFHRSKSRTDNSGWTWSEAVAASKPFVAEILGHVRPALVISEGLESLDLLLEQQGWAARSIDVVLPGRIKVVTTVGMPWAESVTVVALAHPSGFRWSNEDWATAAEVVRKELKQKPPPKSAPPIVRKKGRTP